MTPFVLFAIILLGLALLLIFGVLFFGTLKSIKKRYYPNWKFLTISALATLNTFIVNSLKETCPNKS
jgi:hypothetical protein